MSCIMKWVFDEIQQFHILIRRASLLICLTFSMLKQNCYAHCTLTPFISKPKQNHPHKTQHRHSLIIINAHKQTAWVFALQKYLPTSAGMQTLSIICAGSNYQLSITVITSISNTRSLRKAASKQ